MGQGSWPGTSLQRKLYAQTDMFVLLPARLAVATSLDVDARISEEQLPRSSHDEVEYDGAAGKNESSCWLASDASKDGLVERFSKDIRVSAPASGLLFAHHKSRTPRSSQGDLANILQNEIQHTGTFCFNREYPAAPNPVLALDDFGLIGLPLSIRDAEAIKAYSEWQSSSETGISTQDTSSPGVWHVHPSKVSRLRSSRPLSQWWNQWTDSSLEHWMEHLPGTSGSGPV